MRKTLPLLAAAAALLLPATASADLTLVSQWGSPGVGDSQFNIPTGVAVDAAGNVYAADQNNNRIEKFDAQGTFLASWGGSGNAPGQFSSPQHVKLDPQGNVVVNDSANYRVQKFSPTGTFLLQYGAFGSGAGQFSGNPRGVGVDSAGNVYVLDAGEGGVVSKFAADGTFVTSWGSVGAGPGQWNNPHGLGVDVAGNVYVGDVNNHRVDVFTGDGSFVRSFGTSLAGPGQLGSPNDVAIDSDGSAWVADTAPAALVEFDPSGAPVSRTTGATGPDDRFRSSSVAIGPGDDVFATDNLASRVLHFRQAAPPPVLGVSANAQPLSGVVKVRAPGSTQFVTLGSGDATQIPVGSLIDAKKGKVSLTLAKSPAGDTQKGTFNGGLFKLKQSAATGQKGLTELALSGGKFSSCPKRGDGRIRHAKRRPSRRLFSSVHGRFRTRGRHSTATVRGTKWSMTDTCAGTLTRVTQGSVSVRDLTLRKTKIVKAGHSYLARPARGRR